MMRLKQLLILIIFIWSLGPILIVQSEVTRIDEYKKAIEKDPKDFVAHLELGRAYQKLGLY